MWRLDQSLTFWPLSITEHNHYTKTRQALSFGLLAMSAQDFDPGQLSESQQLALGTYTSVTNQEPSAAIPLLHRSEWNVQVCRRKRDSGVFGGFELRERPDSYCKIL